MRLLNIFMIICLFAFSASSQVNQDIIDNIEKRIELKDSPGIVVGIIENGQHHFYAHGSTAFENGKDLSAETLYEIGSISKVFTSLLLADAIVNGKMSLVDPIQKYLPTGIKAPKRDDTEIKLINLATHRSGLPGMPDNYDWASGSDNPYLLYNESLMLDFLNTYTLPRDPGTFYEYSNYASGLLGYLVGRAQEKSYEQLFKSVVSEPLGMSATTITLSPSQKANMAIGHANGKATSNWDFDALGPAGAWRSTVEDMLKFIKAQLGQEKTDLLDAIKLTQKIQTSDDPKMGLGWHYYNDNLWHNGGTGGFRSFCGIDIENQKGIIVLSNSESSVDDIGLHFLDQTVPLEEPKEVFNIDPSLLKEYHGLYKLAGFMDFNMYAREDGLYGQLAGQEAFKMYPSSETLFFLKAVDAQIEFFRDSDGKISHLILYQNGLEQKATRKE